jgi:membrane complex biogenesis BtpA family protein
MSRKFLEEIFNTKTPVIGVTHLLPLPGSPKYDGMPVRDVAANAVEETKVMVDNGVNAIIFENFHDMPFLKEVGPETTAAMTFIGQTLKEKFSIPLGICLLQADGIGAIAIAKAIELTFIRAPYYTETYVVDTGLIDSIAGKLQRFKTFLKCNAYVLADVHIKHAFPLLQRPIEQSAEDTLGRGLADAIIVTGLKTGGETNPEDIKRVRNALPDAPLIVGSGVSVENVQQYLPYVDGIIISTGFRKNKALDEKMDPMLISQFMKIVANYRKSLPK